MVQLVRVFDDLPEGFEALRAEAEAEGHRHLTRLAQEWAEDPGRFAVVLAAFASGALVGVGALTPEPAPAPEPALRMRRLYVSKAARRQGVARTIASALLQEALDQVRLVTVHAGNSGAAAFWEAQGFAPVAGAAWSHEFRPG
ncbi:GNAT family N-acetyltransferase [Phenylobacterium sp.]|uniref:GNAT family N-acetyltransferase n=1 Tax=Phenylobacterium sp. TaxID=1871053 RepID=UPI002D1C7C8B|nr:GNAT family N-acetyltransferase [Phenylobacterium sp.]HVI32806.1 GNAT family N-acetyltransferase [Phenylobacterium sp.]